MTYFVGIDWADTKHDICILTAEGHIHQELIIADEYTGYQRLHTCLKELEDVHILIERSDGLLVDFLIRFHYAVYVITPAISAGYRLRHGKTDRADAYLLAQLIKQKNPECRRILRNSLLCQQLKQIVSVHDKLQKELHRLALQLRAHLKGYYPAVLKIVRKVTQPLTYAFLKAFPDPQSFVEMTLADLQNFYVSQRYRYMERVAGHFEVLQQEKSILVETTGHQTHTGALVAVMEVIDRQMRQLKRDMKRLLHTHPDYEWLQSIPGLGYLNAARMLVRLGDNRSRFSSPDVLRAIAGTVPVTHRSGKYQAVKFRRACSRSLRKIFVDLAQHSRRYAPWAREYYDQQRARGHGATRANRALANRWVGIVWKLWQSRMLYDADIHRKNRRKQKEARSLTGTKAS